MQNTLPHREGQHYSSDAYLQLLQLLVARFVQSTTHTQDGNMQVLTAPAPLPMVKATKREDRKKEQQQY